MFSNTPRTESWPGVPALLSRFGLLLTPKAALWLAYGALSAASMLPLTFLDKRAALLGAFVNRFSIGFVIGAFSLPWPGWRSGLVIGVLLSRADASSPKPIFPFWGSARLVEP